MEDMKELVFGYRRFLLEIGGHLKDIRDNKLYEGFADTWVDFVKSPEIGFSVSEAETLIKMHDMFCLLGAQDLPSHNAMRLMVNKKVDMELLEDAKVLSLSDFKERIKDKETGNQDRTYRYEVVKRCNETGNIQRVYEEELPEALKALTE